MKTKANGVILWEGVSLIDGAPIAVIATGIKRASQNAKTGAEYLEARKLGYRVFRARLASEPLMEREVSCPASKEAGQKTTCHRCLACGGHSAKAKVDIAIITH